MKIKLLLLALFCFCKSDVFAMESLDKIPENQNKQIVNQKDAITFDQMIDNNYLAIIEDTSLPQDLRTFIKENLKDIREEIQIYISNTFGGVGRCNYEKTTKNPLMEIGLKFGILYEELVKSMCIHAQQHLLNDIYSYIYQYIHRSAQDKEIFTLSPQTVSDVRIYEFQKQYIEFLKKAVATQDAKTLKNNLDSVQNLCTFSKKFFSSKFTESLQDELEGNTEKKIKGLNKWKEEAEENLKNLQGDEQKKEEERIKQKYVQDIYESVERCARKDLSLTIPFAFYGWLNDSQHISMTKQIIDKYIDGYQKLSPEHKAGFQ